MTYEKKAAALANAFKNAENELAILTIKMRDFVMDEAFSGQITKKAFIREAQGIEGAVCRLHLDIAQFDPRPQPMDGGGK